ncbi:acyl-CoA thioesterase [soil metagenome]
MKVAESIHTVRFPDCDPFNHLNNSRYIDYFINAREDHLAQFFNFEIYKHAAQSGKSWVVAQNQIAYLVPALLMEKVIIQSTILELNEADITVEMRMWDAQKSRLKSLLWIKFVPIDLRDGRKITHDKDIMDEFSKYVNSLATIVSFEQRLNDIRNKKHDEI